MLSRRFRRIVPVSWMVTAVCLFAREAAAEGAGGKEMLLFEEIPVVTAAAKHAQTPREAPAFVTIITADEIKKYGHRKFSDILRSVIGFYTSNDRNYGYLGVRGFLRPGDWNSRVVLLINGHVANDYLFGAFGQEYDFVLDLDTIERIEVVRCPGATLYRNDALFAVINVVTKQGKDANGLRVSAAGGGLGTKKGGLAYGVILPNGVDMFFSVSRVRVAGYKRLYFREFDSPETNSGIAEHADAEEAENFLARISYGELSFQGAYVTRDKNIPTAPYETAFNAGRTLTTDSRGFAEIMFDHQLDDSKSLQARAFYDEMSYYGNWPIFHSRVGRVVDWPEAAWEKWWGGEVLFSWQLCAWNRLAFGAEFQDHVLAEQKAWNAVDGLYFDENRPFRVWSLYAQDELSIMKNLRAMVEVRHDNYSTWGQTTNPRFGIVYNLSERTTLKLLHGKAFRAPNLYELYYDDESCKKDNPELRPGDIASWELVGQHDLGRGLFGTVSVYSYDLNNLITEVTDPPTGMVIYENIDRVKAKGVEFELRGKWKGGLQGYVGCAFQEAEDAKTGELLTNSPKEMAKLGTILPLVPDKLFLSGEVQYLGDRLTLSGNHADAYVLTNLNLLYRPLRENLELSVGLYNAFNEKYFDPGGAEHVQDQIPQDGRTFLFKVVYIF